MFKEFPLQNNKEKNKDQELKAEENFDMENKKPENFKNVSNSSDVDVYKILNKLNFIENWQNQSAFPSTHGYLNKHLEEINKIKNKTDNYFINLKIKQMLELSSGNQVIKEQENIKEKYANENLKKHYKVIPKIEDYYSIRTTIKGSHYTKLSDKTSPKINMPYLSEILKGSYYVKINDKYGAIYLSNRGIYSFFELNPRTETQLAKKTKIDSPELSISEVLAKEGFIKEKMDENEYRKLVMTYKILMELPFREKVEEDFGIKIDDYSVREQVQFINFLSTKSKNEIAKVKQFLNQANNKLNKKNRIKSFLSLESGEFSGDEIINIGKNMEDKQADLIFSRYAEIIDTIEQIKEKALDFYKNEKIDKIELDKISEQILIKANNLLILFSNKLKNNTPINEKKVLQELEKYQTDALAFSSIFKIAYNQGGLEFEEIKNINYESLKSSELSNKQKEMIRNVIKLNYPKKEQQKNILEKVEQSFQNGNKSTWNLLTRSINGKEELVSSLRFDEIDDENVYGASFNVGESYKGSKIGEAMFKKTMNEVAKKKRIHAIAEIGKEVSSFYLNEGFNVTGITKNIKTGIYYYQIERFDSENEYYGSKKVKEKDLLSYYDKEKSIEKLVILQKYILVKKENRNKQLNIKHINYLLDHNYIMTKIFSEKNKKENYLVFERRVNLNIQKAA